MTQDERWQAQYDQMMTFMNENHRRPSKHRLEEHDMLNWYKHVKKAIAKGNYPPHRIEKFALLQQVANKYRRKNQYEKQVNESTGQRVNEFWSDKSDWSDRSDGADADTIVSCTKTIVLTSLTS